MPTRARDQSPEVIVEPGELGLLVAQLSRESCIAIDTESASFHRYVDRVYLLQIGHRAGVALIDPLALKDLSPLAAVLGDPTTEIVFHDADYDLRVLDRDYGFRVRHLFDTRVAAQLVGEPAVSLSALLQKHFDVTLNKRLQRADWSRRPLPPEMRAYAAADVRHLLSLRGLLEKELDTLGRSEWAHEEFRRLEAIRWSAPEDGEQYLRIKGARSLPLRTLAVLRSLFEWREATAKRLDRAPFRVMANSALLATARAGPTSRKQLSEVDGLPETVARRHASALVDAVRTGLALPKAELPRISRRARGKPNPLYDQRLERLKLLRNRRATEVNLAPGLLCPNATLQTLARTVPATAAALAQVSGLRSWQREVLGETELLIVLAGEH